jgi:hypothetical protein
MTKRVSLVVTYDTDSEKFTVDTETTEVHFPEGLCWDGETESWADEPDLVEDVVQRLGVQLNASTPLVLSGAREPLLISTKFIELALNVLDPDGKWESEEVLGLGDAACEYLDEYPITDWEIEGAFALVAQFVHDWATGDYRDTAVTTDLTVELFITSALTMVDPDGQLDMEQVLEFSDSARQHLDELRIAGTVHDGQLTDIATRFVEEWQDVNPLPIESAYRPNTDVELEVLDSGMNASITAGRAIE